MCKALGTQHRKSYGSCPQGFYTLEIDKYTNAIQHTKCCAQLHTGALGAEAKGSLNLATAGKSGKASHRGWNRSRILRKELELANQIIPWANSTIISFSVLPELEQWALASIISKPHNLNPTEKPLLSPIYSRLEKVSAWAKTTQDLLLLFPPYAVA